MLLFSLSFTGTVELIYGNERERDNALTIVYRWWVGMSTECLILAHDEALSL